MGQRFGQHFLHDPCVIHQIIAHFEPAKGTAVGEIGPGKGALTKHLLTHKPLTLFEIDPVWIKHWRSYDAHVIAGDVLQQSFVDHLPEGVAKWSLIGNLPYQISGPFMAKCVSERHVIDIGWFMMQKEMVMRCVAPLGDEHYSALSIWLQRYFHLKASFKVLPGSFSPPPKVDSQMLWMKPRTDVKPCVSEDGLHQLLRAVFRYRRKTIGRILKHLSIQIPSEAPFSLTLRPQQMTEDDFIWLLAQSAGE